MADIGDIIGDKLKEELTGMKETLKQSKILDGNPSLLSNDNFEKWVVAQGKVRVLELMTEGKSLDETMEVVRAEIDVARSKQQVNALRKAKNDKDHEKLTKRHRDYRPTVDPDKGE